MLRDIWATVISVLSSHELLFPGTYHLSRLRVPRSMPTSAKPTVFWFRKALRLHDNPALQAAIEGASTLYPIFCLDPWFVSSGRVGANRLHFLLQSLTDLDSSLRALDSQLIVLRGSPEEEIPRAIRHWSIERLCYEIDTEPYAVKRDAKVDELAGSEGAEVVRRWGHTLCNLDELLRRHPGGRPTTTYSAFIGHLDKQLRASPIEIVPTPRALPPIDATALSDAGGPSGGPLYAIPTAAELSLPPQSTSVILRGGETEALSRLETVLSMPEWVAAFEKPSTSPTALDPLGANTRSTTCLSPYLKFGCLSSRLLHERVGAVYKAQPKHSRPPTSLHGQVYWREFYYACARGTPHYERMAGNRICRQVDWDEDDEKLAAWAEARTGYPWIDAAMTQLRHEGWLHHLARHAVACFLTRGDLWQSWERGAEVFEELLLDADPAINRGNWMWLSCSCFFYQYFRCYSPVAFPKKYDKEGAYVRKWLPQLRHFPSKYIYEPWLAPLAEQKRAGCIVGVDYPKPIVDHAVVSKANMARMAKAYAAAKEGTANNEPAGKATAREGGDGDGASSSGASAGAQNSGAGAPNAKQKRALTQTTLPVSKKKA